MKKLIALIVLLAGISSSIFAVTFTVGGNINAGGNLSEDEEFQGFTAGGGLLFNMDFILGFGLQVEANYSTQKYSFKENTVTVYEDYEILDVPVMLWWNGKLGRIGGGLGAGINFASTNADDSYKNFALGTAAGANVIFYFNDDIGLLIGAHGVFDFTPLLSLKEESETEVSSTYTFETVDWKRKAIYGNIGIIYRF